VSYRPVGMLRLAFILHPQALEVNSVRNVMVDILGATVIPSACASFSAAPRRFRIV
jgi:hypothetical protein